MFLPLLPLAILLCSLLTPTHAQNKSSPSGYTNYNLTLTGDPNSLLYQTTSTTIGTTDPAFGPPDVFLNATVHVGSIDILVANLSAKINLDAQVLNLLQFNAGVDVSIDKVNLVIQNVTARVLLEARLENLVLMINDTLKSIDLNPVIAELGSAVGTVVGGVGGALGGTTTTGGAAAKNLTGRSAFELQQGILYSVNDYSGNTHTNRILERDGTVTDQSLDNEGHVYNAQTVGDYITLMKYTGYERSGVVVDGMKTTEREYVYAPYVGLSVIVAVFTDAGGKVVSTRVVSELEAGGGSTVSGEGG